MEDREDKVLELEGVDVRADFYNERLYFEGYPADPIPHCSIWDAEKLGEWLLALWE